jgi:hypothetical protein
MFRSSDRREAWRWSPSPVQKPGGIRRCRPAAISTTGSRRSVSAPLLVCVCDRENLMDPGYAVMVARRVPRGVARHYDSDHFEIYHPPLVAQVLADQTAFLQEHLDVRA